MYTFAHISPLKKNIFSSQIAFSVVAFSGQAALVLFGVPLSNARAEKKKENSLLVQIIFAFTDFNFDEKLSEFRGTSRGL